MWFCVLVVLNVLCCVLVLINMWSCVLVVVNVWCCVMVLVHASGGARDLGRRGVGVVDLCAASCALVTLGSLVILVMYCYGTSRVLSDSVEEWRVDCSRLGCVCLGLVLCCSGSRCHEC